MYNHKTFREPLVLALHWYRHCNTQSSGMEGSLVLGMTALDLLSALVVVDLCRSMREPTRQASCGQETLRTVEGARPSGRYSARYAKLAAFARQNDKTNSCEALAEFRNGFVHPNEKRRNIVLRADKLASFEAWQLSLWYQELAFLYLLDHQGQYRNRTTAEWVGQSNRYRGMATLFPSPDTRTRREKPVGSDLLYHGPPLALRHPQQ